MISGIPSVALPLYWEEAAKLLEPAVKRSGGRMTLDLMYRQLMARDTQLWAAFDQHGEMLGAWTSQINIYAGQKVCELLYCGGRNIQSWLDSGLDITEAWACSKGCDSITIVGRTGWGRITEHRGYGHFATIIEKKLNHGQVERRSVSAATDGTDDTDANV